MGQIVIGSEELRSRVSEWLGYLVPDALWSRAEPFARQKLWMCLEQDPECTFYNEEYLVLLAADTVREFSFRDHTIRTIS